ncbi:MAG: type II glyceraldehyde-3-phosphate dehydrogenase [Acidilobus sp.]
MIRVAVNGYGTIGKRVADAVSLQPDMRLIGVAKIRPSFEALGAVRAGIQLFVPEGAEEQFERAGIRVAGTVRDMISSADVVVDATPDGVGEKNRPAYESAGVRAIFQGGEEPEVAEASFSTLCNYDEAVGRRFVRVVSCNTTSLLRVICSLQRVSRLRRVRAVIVRRAADTKEVRRGPINAILPNPARTPSHHARDVKTVLRDLDIFTMAVIVPTTLMHMHLIYAYFDGPVRREDVIEALSTTPRIVLIPPTLGVEGTAHLFEVGRDLGRMRGDMPEVMVFSESVGVSGDEVALMYAVHQESVVTPENVDAIRAVTGTAGREESLKITDSTLNIMRGWLA